MSKARQNYMAKADVLFAQRIKERDGACVICGSTEYVQCAHLISRSYKSIRTNPRNAVALCRSHHLYYTNRPLEWREWVDYLYPGRWAELSTLALRFEKIDWKSEYESLRVGLEER